MVHLSRVVTKPISPGSTLLAKEEIIGSYKKKKKRQIGTLSPMHGVTPGCQWPAPGQQRKALLRNPCSSP